MFVKPDCLIPGSFPNLLVYLRPAHRVKKTARVSCAGGSATTMGLSAADRGGQVGQPYQHELIRHVNPRRAES